MKKVGYFLVAFFIFCSCTVNKAPEFIKVTDVKVTSIKNDTVRIKASAFFKNPNSVGGKIITDKIFVSLDGKEIAQVFAETTKLPANKEFFLPLEAVIPTKKLFQKNKNDLLTGILNILSKRSINLNFNGKITYKKFFYKKDFLIDENKEIKLRK